MVKGPGTDSSAFAPSSMHDVDGQRRDRTADPDHSQTEVGLSHLCVAESHFMCQ
jgi:hypothetical protein